MNPLAPVLDLLYPRVCGGCGAMTGGEGAHLCWDCQAALEPVSAPFCDCCGDPVDGVVAVAAYRCSFCRRRRDGFDLARSAVRYRGPIKDILRGYKYGGQIHLAEDLARLLAVAVRVQFCAVRFDAVIEVPLFRARERRRAFNQSRLLARRLARALELELAPIGALRRTRDTVTQTGLTAIQRDRNVRQAFAVGEPAWIEGRVLLLVDDVMTTGATVHACARAARAGGAAGVYVVTVARG